MDFNGLFGPYPIDRPLTAQERERQLVQKQPLDLKESDDLSVIRFNSTYMEVVDKWFPLRGIFTSLSLGGAALIGYFFVAILLAFVAAPDQVEGSWFWSVVLCIIAAPFFWLMWVFFRKDNFLFTHYPIRFNTRGRVVHVFRTNGTVVSVPWESIFFCMVGVRNTAAQPKNWEIQGHLLGDDGITVKETFALPSTGVGDGDRDQLLRYWEFVRRYMEDGAQAVERHVSWCLPIARQRERFTDGFHRMHSFAAALPLPLMIFLLLIYLSTFPGRWISMRTSKLPEWPLDVESVCTVAPNDPYGRDASTNPSIADHSLIYVVSVIAAAVLIWVWL